jgi:hypothetical protein
MEKKKEISAGAIVSISMALFFPLAALIVGIVSLSKINKSKDLGGKTLAIVAICVSSFFFLLRILYLIMIIIMFSSSGLFSVPEPIRIDESRIGSVKSFSYDMMYCPTEFEILGYNLRYELIRADSEYECLSSRIDVADDMEFKIIDGYSYEYFGSFEEDLLVLEDENGVMSVYGRELYESMMDVQESFDFG